MMWNWSQIELKLNENGEFQVEERGQTLQREQDELRNKACLVKLGAGPARQVRRLARG